MSAPGTLLAGRYRLEHLLGSGASAHVYAATDELLQLPVAIKILHDATDADRQIREATLAMSLHHPAIVHCYGAASEDETRFIVMELVGGETLAERMLREPLALDEILAVLTSTAEALQHAHERNLVHRDISPGNLLTVVREGRIIGARVIDFGVAKHLSAPSAPTQTVGIGTAAYAAPEQLAGRPTAQSDLYGLGAVLVHMLTGHPPVIGGSNTRTLPPTTPVWLASLTADLLRPDPQRRVQSATELLARIPRNPGRTTSIGSRRRILVIAALLSAALATAAGMVAFSVDARYRAGRICSWLESTQLITWTNQRVLGTMAMSAADLGDVQTLERLFSHNRMPPERRQWLLADCLHAAIQKGHVAAVSTLIDLGAVISTDKLALTSELMSQVQLSRSSEMLQLLASRGMNMRHLFESTNPFTAATINGDRRIFQTLLSLLNTLPELPPLKDPPLWVAATSGDPELYLPLVIAQGPRIVNAVDHTGAHTLIRALHKLSLPVLRRLLEIPSLDLELHTGDGSTALIFASASQPEEPEAVRLDRIEACKLLIARGANVNARNRAGNRPLLIAAELQLLELTKLLLARPEIEVNAQDERGDTALHRALAAQQNFTPEIVTLLRAHGARDDLANFAGETPRQRAERLGREHLLGSPHG